MNMQNRLGQAVGQVAESQLSVDAAGTGSILPGPRGLAKPPMIVEPARLWFLSAVVVYGIGMLYSIFIWQRGFQRDNWIHYGLLAFAFALHTVAMAKRGFSLNQCPVNNLYEATAFVLWTITAGSLALGLLPKLRFLGVFTSPLLFGFGLFALWPGLDTEYVENQPNFSSDWFSLHVPIILLGYGAFGLGATAGSMFLNQERNLKSHRAVALFALLPPIQRLEKIITAALVVGLTLLTIGVGIGAAFVEPNTPFWSDSKTIWSFLVWSIYGGLLLSHLRFDQRGRRYAWLAIIAFCFVILTFWGTNLLSGIHNPTP